MLNSQPTEAHYRNQLNITPFLNSKHNFLIIFFDNKGINF